MEWVGFGFRADRTPNSKFKIQNSKFSCAAPILPDNRPIPYALTVFAVFADTIFSFQTPKS